MAEGNPTGEVRENPDESVFPRRPRVLLGLSGSVASIKARPLIAALCAFADVRVVATASAEHFIRDLLPPSPPTEAAAASASAEAPGEAAEAVPGPAAAAAAGAAGAVAIAAPAAELAFSALADSAGAGAGAAPVEILRDCDEWSAWRRIGDPVLHIELRRWADVLLIAPLSANTLAKIAHGLSDNLLTCVARAWDFSKPMLLAPSMNTAMWLHPLTSKQLAEIASWGTRPATAAAAPPAGSPGSQPISLPVGQQSAGQLSAVVVIAPVSKRLACGDLGAGAMAEVPTIVEATRAACCSAAAAAAASALGPFVVLL